MRDTHADLVILIVFFSAVFGAAIFDLRAGLVVGVVLAVAAFALRRPPPERYRQALENSPNAIFMVDQLGRIRLWNRASETTFQYDREIIGQPFDRLMADAGEAERVRTMLDEIYAGGAGFLNVDLSYRTRAGEVHEMMSRLYPITNSQGKVSECVISNTEVTARKQMETALRTSEDRFRQIADNIEEVFYIYDPSANKVIYISPAIERLWERPASQLYENPGSIFEVIHPDDGRLLDQAAASGKDHELELRLLLPSGDVRWARMRNRFVYDPETGSTHIIGVIEDITTRKQADRLALEQEQRRILADFIRDASHEFRTPLAIINTKLYLVSHVSDPVRVEQLAADMSEQVAQIDRLLESLVLMARLDSGAPFDKQPINLRSLLVAFESVQHAAAEAQRVTITLDLSESLPPLEADAPLLGHAFHHLLDNALRYTPPGGRITIRAFVQDHAIVVDIHDTGAGISPGVLPHVFERFYRDDSAHSTRGFGLGLPIAQKIIEGHGGHITIESTVGQGCLVHVRLPILIGPVPAP
ncbi:MAG: PAS domain-containing sensor histidine kinase [Anaerolineae bacterium]|nr:PAS domain-containing sensor histidine kinase [Anaerolineae bacterium]